MVKVNEVKRPPYSNTLPRKAVLQIQPTRNTKVITARMQEVRLHGSLSFRPKNLCPEQQLDSNITFLQKA